MSKTYTASQVELQQRFHTEALASRLAELAISTEFSEADKAFIESRDLFFLATVDALGQPTCSHKGGTPGFVRVDNPKTLSFPLYDGNGMFLSAGNVADTAKIGLLFIDLETPHRLRVEGTARIVDEAAVIAAWPGALLAVVVEISAVFINCPRYIHRYRREQASAYVPREDGSAPLPAWKRLELFQDVIAPADAARVAEAGGPITIEAYRHKLHRGEA